MDSTAGLAKEVVSEAMIQEQDREFRNQIEASEKYGGKEACRVKGIVEENWMAFRGLKIRATHFYATYSPV